ncbi:hypothetical protein SD37_11595 [Amycolatopsis orientalis]|uniref:Uncharacterized protein n=1 Tax=Amycolatopsis orientalis TaxID=31958 RepID=A0A193BVG4_AMYOR|nr:hypothetical protein [Amycolatopsis orientalis]ANN16221.1 hypothetical protein SD37_11595 [Amycolatopsis orientalis]
MTLDPGQPTREVDLAHVDEFFLAGAAVLALGLTLIALGWTSALALAMAALCLACPNDLEPPQ